MVLKTQLLRLATALSLVLISGLTPAANAQTFTGTANVINLLPNTLVGHEDLDFGSMIAPTAAATLTMNAQTGAMASTGGLILAGGSPNQGEFTGYGTANRLVLFNSPVTITLKHTNGVDQMTVDTLRMSVNGGAPSGMFTLRLLNSSGFIFLKVGGRLSIAAGQKDGGYSGTYLVTANYF